MPSDPSWRGTSCSLQPAICLPDGRPTAWVFHVKHQQETEETTSRTSEDGDEDMRGGGKDPCVSRETRALLRVEKSPCCSRVTE